MSLTLKQIRKQFRVLGQDLHAKLGMDLQNPNLVIQEFKGKFTIKSLVKDLNLNLKDNLNVVYTVKEYGDGYKDTCGVVLESETSFNTDCPSHHYSKKHFDETRKIEDIKGFVISIPKNTLIDNTSDYSYRRNPFDNVVNNNLMARFREDNKYSWVSLGNKQMYLSSSQLNMLDKSGYVVEEFRRQLKQRLANKKLKKLQNVSCSMFNKDNAEIYNMLIAKKQDIIEELTKAETGESIDTQKRRLDSLAWVFRDYEIHIKKLQECNTSEGYYYSWSNYKTIEGVQSEIKSLKDEINKI